jgi:hypothetical protein
MGVGSMAKRDRTLRGRLVVGTTALMASLALAACGGGDDEQAVAQDPPSNPPSNPPPSPPANRAPTITGAPATQVMQGTQYSFTPTAADADGDALTFSIVNKPTWASFDTSNGRLSGAPTAADVGVTQNIQISVSDGRASASLAPFSISVVATATGSALLTWTPPTTNTDGSPLTLTGYKVYWGTSQGNYPNSRQIPPGVASHVVEPLTPATWYFVVTALSATGESAYSNVASKVVR